MLLCLLPRDVLCYVPWLLLITAARPHGHALKFLNPWLLLLGTPSPSSHVLRSQARNSKPCLSQFCPAKGYRFLYSPIRDNLGTRLPKCRFSHPWGQPGLGGQYLALQHVPKDQTSTRTSGGFSGLHIKSQTQLCVPLIPLLGRWRQKDSRGF